MKVNLKEFRDTVEKAKLLHKTPIKQAFEIYCNLPVEGTKKRLTFNSFKLLAIYFNYRNELAFNAWHKLANMPPTANAKRRNYKPIKSQANE